MSKLTDLFQPGQEYWQLTFIELAEDDITPSKTGSVLRNAKGRFKCRCGNVVVKRLHNVKVGKTKACGCMRGRKINGDKNEN